MCPKPNWANAPIGPIGQWATMRPRPDWANVPRWALGPGLVWGVYTTFDCNWTELVVEHANSITEEGPMKIQAKCRLLAKPGVIV